MKRMLLAAAVLVTALAAALAAAMLSSGQRSALPVPRPTLDDYELISTGTTPPTQTQCASVRRRCFSPTAMQNSYNLGPLYAQGYQGQGITIGIVDSFGSDTMTHDLHVFNNAF